MNGIDEKLDAKKDEAPTIDSWEAAFAALEQRNKKEPEETPAGRDGQPDAGESGQAEGTSGSDVEPMAEGQSDDAQLDGADTGGSGAADGAAGETVSEFDYSAEEVNETISSIESSIEDQAVSDVANAMKASGKIRVTRDGKLGASINDPDIYTKDEDGVPTYINPETGRPFTGDNPRAQAKQWVDDYNAELEQAFNKIAKQRIDELKKEKEPIVRTLKFAETYKKLNDVQRDMLDSLIEDYEVKDEDGKSYWLKGLEYDILVTYDKPRGGLSILPQFLKKVQGGYVYLAMWDLMNDYVLRSSAIGLISYPTTDGIYLVDNGVWMGEISGFIFGVYDSQDEEASFMGYTDAVAAIRLIKKTIEE